jgi:hypothetical protein
LAPMEEGRSRRGTDTDDAAFVSAPHRPPNVEEEDMNYFYLAQCCGWRASSQAGSQAGPRPPDRPRWACWESTSPRGVPKPLVSKWLTVRERDDEQAYQVGCAARRAGGAREGW